MNLRALILPGALAALFALVQPGIGQAQDRETTPPHVVAQFGLPPEVADGPLPEALPTAVQFTFVESVESVERGRWGEEQRTALATIVEAGDPRLAWIISDLIRFVSGPGLTTTLSDAAADLLGIDRPTRNHWGIITDHLIAWDIPAPPDYLPVKRAIFTSMVPRWEPIFVDGDVDWRHVSWGGVLIDDRPYDRTDEPCNCIPAADNPQMSSAAEATWLKDEDVVFGIEMNGEFRAYPRRIMEVREMVNDTLGGRNLGIPYCTLCGAAQAYFTDNLPAGIERPILRTSGLLIRSNKVMYDIETYSVFDTFLGKAVTGPLAEQGLKLEQASVVTTDWGSWKEAHPETTVPVEALALGRDFDFRNNRDANGPIFPVGDVDPRLTVHEHIIGVVTKAGQPVAFQRSAAMVALLNGENITFENVRLALNAGGIKAVDANGSDLGSH